MEFGSKGALADAKLDAAINRIKTSIKMNERIQEEDRPIILTYARNADIRELGRWLENTRRVDVEEIVARDSETVKRLSHDRYFGRPLIERFANSPHMAIRNALRDAVKKSYLESGIDINMHRKIIKMLNRG
ncbi:MAG: hypothetical protein ACREBF_03700 [Candidatus Micrarchaeales archaeon]